MQCFGRQTLERKNIPELKFANKPKFGFFLPARCTNTTDEKLCESCKNRQERIPVLLEKWKGSMQNQSEQIHGLIGEAIPEWSRIYRGPYYLGKIQAGWSISEESERIAEEAYKGIEMGHIDMPPRKKVEPKLEPELEPKKEVIPAEPITKKRSAQKKKVLEPEPEPEPEPKSEPKPEPKPEPKKRAPPKKKTDPTPIAVIDTSPQSEVDVITVKVKTIEIDSRKVYLSSEKDKVYDTKFNYLGRYNRRADTIETGYPDSDA